jgi:hypothetical protein
MAAAAGWKRLGDAIFQKAEKIVRTFLFLVLEI